MTAPAVEVVLIDGRQVQRVLVVARCLRCQFVSYRADTADTRARQHRDEAGHKVVVITTTTDVLEPPEDAPARDARWEVAGA